MTNEINIEININTGRKIFSVDTGNMPISKAEAYLERVKGEIQSKRITNK